MCFINPKQHPFSISLLAYVKRAPFRRPFLIYRAINDTGSHQSPTPFRFTARSRR